MHEYLKNLQYIYHNGKDRGDRTGTGTRSVFGKINMEFDLHVGAQWLPTIPLLTTKRIHLPSVIHELLWMLSGDTDVRYLKENKVRIWDEWVIPETAKYRTLMWGERIRLMSKKPEYEDFLHVTDMMREDGRSQEHIIRVQSDKMDRAGVPDKVLVSGDLGPVYGAQWRKWQDTQIVWTEKYQKEKASYDTRGYRALGEVPLDLNLNGTVLYREVDQIARLEERLQNNPECRRLIVSAWNVAKLDEMALPPCHTLAQWYVETNEDGEQLLSCKLYQRSGDFFLGVPFNIAFYSILTHMLAAVHGMKAHKFYHTCGDAHIYHNHFDQVAEQLGRLPSNEPAFIDIRTKDEANYPYSSILDINYQDIRITGYNPMPGIAAPVAV